MSGFLSKFRTKEYPALIEENWKIFGLIGICFLIFITQAVYGFGYYPFGDEAGHDLGALAIEKGDILYRDYVDAHGPFVYFISWLVGKIVGYKNFSLFRIGPVIITSATAFYLYYSSSFSCRAIRLISPALFLGLLGPVWIVQALNMNGYWIYGGDLTVLACSQIVVPSLLNMPIKKWSSIVGGASLILLPFVAYSFLPSVFLFSISLLIIFFQKNSLFGKKELTYTLYGSVGALFIFLLWMFFYADLEGFIVYHFINNQFYYSHYIPFGIGAVFKSLRPSLLPENLVQTLAIFSFVIASAILIFKSPYKISSIIALGGILFLDARGGTSFQNGAFVIASVGLLAQMFPMFLNNSTNKLFQLSSVLVVCSILVGLHAISSPFNESYAQRRHVGFHFFRSSDNLIDQKIRQYARPDERILVIPYNPNVYIEAGRLPIKKYHAYLPWEADYAKHPVVGYERDICVDLPQNPPPVIYFDNWTVWGIWKPESFMGCVVHLLDMQYDLLPGIPNVYVRKDRLK